MKKIILSLSLFLPVALRADSLVVTDVTPAAVPLVTHRVAVPPSIAVDLAPQLLTALDPQHPADKIVRTIVVQRTATGGFVATIVYLNGGN